MLGVYTSVRAGDWNRRPRLKNSVNFVRLRRSAFLNIRVHFQSDTYNFIPFLGDWWYKKAPAGAFLGYRAFEGFTVNKARPFRRLAAIILAPAAVAILTKNPWVVARFCLLG